MAKVDVKQLLGVVKKNAISIAAGVVALGAVAVPFLVADPKLQEVQTDLGTSKSLASNVESVVKNSRKEPLLDPSLTEAKPLEAFPTKDVIAAGKAAIAHLGEQSTVVLLEALKLNVHKPLVREVFTTPPGGQYITAFDRFRDDYLKIMPDPMNRDPKAATVEYGLNKIMGGARPYSPEEITRAATNAREKIAQEKAIRQGGQVINQTEITELQRISDAQIPIAMRNDVAIRNSVYVSADTWTASREVLSATAAVRPEVVWMAQMGLWIQEDVARLVSECNRGSKSVFTSPVKHLVKVEFDPINPYAVMKTAAEGSQAAVTVTGVKPDAAITLMKNSSLTGRASNGLFDVVHYRMTVRMAENYVPEFLSQIAAGRLHYVLNVQMRAIDSPSEAGLGFVYGNDHVVELQISCEALFLRSWTEKLMPRVVRELVGIDPPTVVAPPH